MTKVAIVFGDEDFDMSPYPLCQLIRVDETKFFSVIAERIGLIDISDLLEMPMLIKEAFRESATTEGPVRIERLIRNFEPVVLAMRPCFLNGSKILAAIWDAATIYGIKTVHLTDTHDDKTQAPAQ